MLVHLSITNLAIISHLEVSFRSGLNILSGETGAGKSIIINAVNLILGGRASTDLIRSGADEARVEALFRVTPHSTLRAVLEETGVPFQEEIVIKRILSREGRNRVMVNGSLTSLHALSGIGQMLISISGQHEHQVLLRPESHLYLLDDFGGLAAARQDLAALFAACQAMKEKCRRLEREIRDGEERQDLTRFQVEEIERAGIRPGEDLLLDEERSRLRNSQQIREALGDAYHTLYEKDGAVLSEFASCLKKMEKGAELDREIRSVKDKLSSLRVDLEEAVLELRDLRKRALDDPRRLEEVEGRIQDLNRLKRKYGPSLDQVCRHWEGLTATLEDLGEKREALRKAVQETEGVEAELVNRAGRLSAGRRKAARALEQAVMEELKRLAMGGTVFEATFQEGHPEEEGANGSPVKAMRPDGMDRIEFMLSTNPGEELKPLSRIASGGELSRIMLGLKTILARTGSVETIVFDEVDSGIGGATAEVVGEKLRSLAAFHQILCITHLPQIACKGETHFLVWKIVEDRRAVTSISELAREERVMEVARLLGGKTISEKVVAHAREILG